MRNPARRKFIVDSAAIAGGSLALGFNIPALAEKGAASAKATEVNAWVVIKPDNSTVIRVARSEMGQGTITGLAQLVAEELECDWQKVSVEQVTPGQNLARKRVWGEMSTGGSRGIRTSHDYVRRGGAAARLMLVQAAAQQWNVPAAQVSTANGVLMHGPTKRMTTYGAVAPAAAGLTPPDAKSIRLKDPRTWRVAGQPLKRLDTADKLNGSKLYSIDFKLPGMLLAAVKQCPVFTGKLVSYDESKALGMPGVKRVIKVNDHTVAVVADTWWRAKSALEALPIVWDEGPAARQSSETIAERLNEGLTASEGPFASWERGEALKAIDGAAKKVEAVYSTPFLSHATMEPMNAMARWTPERVEVWAPTQNAEASLAAAAEEAELPLDKAEVYRLDLGGGFGRRGGTQDYTRLAVAIARHFSGVPVKTIWSREEDQAHDFYRPVSMCKLSAGVDEKGELVGLHVRVSGQSINAYLNPGGIKGGKDMRQLQGLYRDPGDAQLGYTVPNLLIEYAMRNTHVPVGPWRGVNTNQNGVYMECFIEEVARAAGRDSLEFRRSLMREHPRHLAVLEAAAKAANYDQPLPPGVHRGIAQFMGYGSYSAAVAEVSIEQEKVKVHRIVIALNSGHAVNPGQIAAQVEGSVAYGLSATFYGEISIEKGRVAELNFDRYPILRLAGMPKVETVLVPSYDFWGGVGEPTICVVAPSVMNAIFAATGKPVRSLPLRKVGLA